MTLLSLLACAGFAPLPDGAYERQAPSALTTDRAFVIESDNDENLPGAYGIRTSSAWWSSTSTGGFSGADYRVAPTARVADGARFWFRTDATRCYTVDARWTPEANRASAATFVFQDATGRELGRTTVDQTTGGTTWTPLGEVDFPAGDNQVVLSRWAAPGAYVVADAVRLTPCDEASAPNAPTGGETATDTGGTAPVAASASIASPADGATVDNPVTFTVAGSGVDRLVLSADGWVMKDWRPAEEGWSQTYTFSQTGARTVLLDAYDATGARIASDTVDLTILADGVDLAVPYFYQYDNAYEPSGTCGVTSTAMALNYRFPGRATPDSLYLRYGKPAAQSPSGIAAIYEAEGLYAEWGLYGTRDTLLDHLDAGRPVVVHGFWTGAGHIAVIVGYDENDWIVNDPAGDWYTCYGCGEADHIRYPRGGSWDDELSVDGDIWYSTADRVPF